MFGAPYPKPDPDFSEIGFYLVWNPEGRNPQHRHRDEQSALTEAQRLAREHPGAQFYVLAGVAVAATRDPVVVTRLSSDPIPF